MFGAITPPDLIVSYPRTGASELPQKDGCNRRYLVGFVVVVQSAINSLFGCTLAYKINFKITWVYKMNLVKYIRYKASDPIKFGRGKEFINGFDLVQDFLFSLFYLVLFTQCVI